MADTQTSPQIRDCSFSCAAREQNFHRISIDMRRMNIPEVHFRFHFHHHPHRSCEPELQHIFTSRRRCCQLERDDFSGARLNAAMRMLSQSPHFTHPLAHSILFYRLRADVHIGIDFHYFPRRLFADWYNDSGCF